MSGIDTVVNKTIMGVVNDTKNAYYDVINDVRPERIDLYETGDLNAYKNVFYYDQIMNYNPLDVLSSDLQNRWGSGVSTDIDTDIEEGDSQSGDPAAGDFEL